MERILTVEQMKAADAFTINNLGIEEQTLIERAGFAVADEINRRFKGGRVLVCVGCGNNGEDGKVIAKVLSNIHGFSVATLTVQNGIFRLLDNKFDIIVDCIFGTGLNRNVEGKYKEVIEKINNSGAYIVSVDIPSGLNGNTGYPMGVAVKANLTVALGEYKLGYFLGDGIDYTGKLILKDIGISVWDDKCYYRLNSDDAKKFFLPRKRNVNKGSFGKTVVVGGSSEYSGSVLLSLNALCALKTGAGYINLTVPKSIYKSYIGLCPEATFSFLEDNDGHIVFDEKGLSKLLKYNSICFGMGMGKSKAVYDSIKYLLNNYDGNLLIDADGLNSLSEYGVHILKGKKCKVVLTPHVKEFSRLIKTDKDLILTDVIKYAEDFAKEYNVVLIVKSAVSVITDGEKTVINTTGTNALSKGGSGDTLSGFTAGLLSRDEDVLETVAVANFVFGRATEIATEKENEYTVTASDVIKCLPDAINSL